MKFIEDIHSVFERDPSARNAWEIITCYSGVQAMLFYRLTHRLWLLKLKWLARFVSMFARWLTGVEIHPAAKIGRRFFIDHGMGVVIGETAEIGDDCTLYHGVTLGGTTWEKGKRHPTLGNNIVIGAGAKVLGPIMIESGARIGSNAVVVRDVFKNETVIGVPGRVLSDKSEHLSFDAYGVSNDNDPNIDTIKSILERLERIENKDRTKLD